MVVGVLVVLGCGFVGGLGGGVVGDVPGVGGGGRGWGLPWVVSFRGLHGGHEPFGGVGEGECFFGAGVGAVLDGLGNPFEEAEDVAGF